MFVLLIFFFPEMSAESELHRAVRKQDEPRVKEILAAQPSINVDWKDDSGFSALHRACLCNASAIVSLLLLHPGVDVNSKNYYGVTCFATLAAEGNIPHIQRFLWDPTVVVNEPDYDGCTPLYHIIHSKQPDVVKWWIASGRDMDLGTPGNPNTDAIGEARRIYTWDTEEVKLQQAKLATLLERFKENPDYIRYATRLELGFVDELASYVFGLTVFLCDGLLQTTTTTRTAAFFRIAQRLPLELQTVLCLRLFESAKEIIPSKDRDRGFSYLAKLFGEKR